MYKVGNVTSTFGVNIKAEWKSDDIGDISKVDNESNRKLQENDISEWRCPGIQKRYYITFLLLLFNFLDLHIYKNSMNALRESEIIEWASLKEHFDMNSVGHLGACFIGFFSIHRIGGAAFVGVGNLGKAIICLTFPVLLNTKMYPLIAHSLTFGFFQGLTYIGAVDVFAHWSPPNERVRLTTFASLGHGFAIATYDIMEAFSSSTLFHTHGMMILIMAILWLIVVRNDPSQDKYVSEEERTYLCQVINYIPREKTGVPFKSILTSIPVYVLMSTFFVLDIVTSFLSFAPYYFDIGDALIKGNEILNIVILELGPYLLQAFAAWFIDSLRSKHNSCSINKIHKTSLLLGQFLTVTFVFICGIWDDKSGSIKFFSLFLAKIAFGLPLLSLRVILIDVAGPHAGVLKSLINFFRIIVAYFRDVIFLSGAWQISFLITALLVIIGTIMFLVFGYGDSLPWSTVPDAKKAIINDVDSEANPFEYKNMKNIRDSENGII